MGLVRALLLIGTLGLSSCAETGDSRRPSGKWTTGFWFWPGGAVTAATGNVTVDALFFHAGTIGEISRPYLQGQLPNQLPPAREYWLVFRFERQEVPDIEAAAIVVRRVAQLMEDARLRHLNVAGVQLDIDSPTSKLSQYARFLREFRKSLPENLGISITALLDWFREGTAIADVIGAVDEFVPQFYDIGRRDECSGGEAIAARIDSARWGPRFNRFGKRYRIGISTFGRGRLIASEGQPRPQYLGFQWYRDLTPIEVAVHPAFSLETARNEAAELVLSYRATRASRIGYNRIERGETVQFILSTPETVRMAVEGAKQMGRYSAGVIFFRWPGVDEALVMEPSEVLRAAGAGGDVARKPPGVETIDGGCAAVHCVDVYLTNARPFVAQAVRYRIRSSTQLEYFLPEEGMPVRMSGAGELELTVPPYCGRSRMYLGRAVSSARAEFKVKVAQ